MKVPMSVFLFLSFQVVVLFGYITKEISLVRLSYRVQRAEQEVARLATVLKNKETHLHALQNRAQVWDHVKSEWGMKKMDSRQLHEI
ncbi:MAG: hypothetical protein UU47_C0015G0003 [candidate division TM6 bacterium GW2011_GWE2_41_16]|nr:MAG: hypothetical protein UU47_C0015G0003 [candidate division TM6 bacterium GW2011_GWE2_41_16]